MLDLLLVVPFENEKDFRSVLGFYASGEVRKQKRAEPASKGPLLIIFGVHMLHSVYGHVSIYGHSSIYGHYISVQCTGDMVHH